MNIDPKSETPEQIAAKHSLKASGNHHDYNGSWVVDAMVEFAQSENLRLQKINDELVKACQLYMRIISDEGCIPDMEQIELTDKMQSALKKAKSNP